MPSSSTGDGRNFASKISIPGETIYSCDCLRREGIALSAPPNFPGFCRNCVGNVGTSVETVVETVANIVETVEYLFWGWII